MMEAQEALERKEFLVKQGGDCDYARHKTSH